MKEILILLALLVGAVFLIGLIIEAISSSFTKRKKRKAKEKLEIEKRETKEKELKQFNALIQEMYSNQRIVKLINHLVLNCNSYQHELFSVRIENSSMIIAFPKRTYSLNNDRFSTKKEEHQAPITISFEPYDVKLTGELEKAAIANIILSRCPYFEYRRNKENPVRDTSRHQTKPNCIEESSRNIGDVMIDSCEYFLDYLDRYACRPLGIRRGNVAVYYPNLLFNSNIKNNN